MRALKYKVIKDRAQYNQYCKELETLLELKQTPTVEDEVELLTLLIHSYDELNNIFNELDPITLLRSFMTEHGLKSANLVTILGVSKGYVSDILNYKKGLSKEVVRKLATHFKVRQEAFNRPYSLTAP